MQFAQRQRLSQRLGKTLLVGTVLGLLLGFAGPFGTYPSFPTATRYAFWIGLTLAGVIAVLATDTGLPMHRLRGGLVRVGAVALLSAIPMTFVVAWTMTQIQQDRAYSPPQLLGLFWGVAAVQLLIAYACIKALPPLPKPLSGDPGAEVTQDTSVRYPEFLLSKLPAGSDSKILALETEDHYLRVHTESGTALILMKMTDAVALLHPELGAQVHRRWWVAAAGVAGMRVQEQKSVLVLTNGKSVPVGRSFAAAARSRFGPGMKSAQAD